MKRLAFGHADQGHSTLLSGHDDVLGPGFGVHQDDLSRHVEPLVILGRSVSNGYDFRTEPLCGRTDTEGNAHSLDGHLFRKIGGHPGRTGVADVSFELVNPGLYADCGELGDDVVACLDLFVASCELLPEGAEILDMRLEIISGDIVAGSLFNRL